MENKFWKIIEIIAGVILIYIGITNFAGFASAQTIGASIVNLLEIILGSYWIYDAIKNWERK